METTQTNGTTNRLFAEVPEDPNERIRLCQEELQATLDKYRCKICRRVVLIDDVPESPMHIVILPK